MTGGWDFSNDLTAARLAAEVARREGRGGVQSLHIPVVGRIDADQLAVVRHLLGGAPYAHSIDITVDSPGGEAAMGLEIFGAIASHPAEVKRTRIVRAESAAVAVAMAGDHRIADAGASILLHRATQAPPVHARWTAAEHAATADLLAWLDQQEARLLELRTGTPAAVFIEEMQSETSSPLEWCLERKLIHEVKQ